MLPPYLDKGLELGPLTVQHLSKAVSPSLYDHQVDPERFSFRCSIAHVADWELINLERIQAGVNAPGSMVMGLDEGQRAIDQGYETWDPVEQAQVYVTRRKAFVDYVKGLSDEQLAHVFVHSERGPSTVLNYLVTILGHDVYHVEHLARYLSQ